MNDPAEPSSQATRAAAGLPGSRPAAQDLWRFALVPAPGESEPTADRVAAAIRHAEASGLRVAAVVVTLEPPDPPDGTPPAASRVRGWLKRSWRRHRLRARWPENEQERPQGGRSAPTDTGNTPTAPGPASSPGRANKQERP